MPDPLSNAESVFDRPEPKSAPAGKSGGFVPRSGFGAGNLDSIYSQAQKNLAAKKDLSRPEGKEGGAEPASPFTRGNFKSARAKDVGGSLYGAFSGVFKDSYRTRDAGQKSMGRMLGVKNPNDRVQRNNLIEIGKAIKEKRYSAPVLGGFKKEELKRIQFDTARRNQVLKGLGQTIGKGYEKKRDWGG